MKNTLLSLIFALLSTTLFAWGQNGHRIIAKICDLHLTSDAKTEVQEILGRDYLEELSTWPDFIRSEKNWKFTNTWHYTTVHPDKTVDDVTTDNGADEKINDVIEGIELMIDILEEDTEAINFFEDLMERNHVKPLKGSTKATALAFLLHFIGDIHQPMHVGKNRDLGGNKISVLFFSENTNIHAVWDTRMIDHEKLSYTEFAMFINKASDAQITELQNVSLQGWAAESIKAREQIYNTLYDFTDRETGLPSLSYQYQHDFIPVVKERLLAGGIRAAGVLNAIFG